MPGVPILVTVQQVFIDPNDPRNEGGPSGLPGSYSVVFTLSRPGFSAMPDRSLSFEAGLEGDSHLAIAPPAYVPAGFDTDPIVAINISAVTSDGAFEYRGIPNKNGFLGKIRIDNIQANSIKEAELRAFRALSSQLSSIAMYADVPLHICQVDITEHRTGTVAASHLSPFVETFLGTLPLQVLTPDFRFYASLYREALSSSSSNYQFLCYFKIIEGIRKRNKRRATEAHKSGKQVPAAPVQRIPASRPEQEEWLSSLFPLRRNWHEVVLQQVFLPVALGRKLNDVIDKELTTIRDKIAHAVLDADEPTVLMDEGHDRTLIDLWLPLAKCISRVLIRNEFPDVFVTATPPSPSSAA